MLDLLLAFSVEEAVFAGLLTLLVWWYLLPYGEAWWTGRARIKQSLRSLRGGDKRVPLPAAPFRPSAHGEYAREEADCSRRAEEVNTLFPRSSAFLWHGKVPVLHFLDPRDIYECLIGGGSGANDDVAIEYTIPPPLKSALKGSFLDSSSSNNNNGGRRIHGVLVTAFSRERVEKLYVPAFTAQAQVFPLLASTSGKRVERSALPKASPARSFKQESAKGAVTFIEVEVVRLFRISVAQALLSVVFGSDVMGTSQGVTESQKFGEALADLLHLLSTSPSLAVPSRYTQSSLSLANRRAKDLCRQLTSLTNGFLARSRKRVAAAASSEASSTFASKTVLGCLIDGGVDDTDTLVATVLALMVCGVGPTAAAMAWVMQLLSCNKTEYVALMKELQAHDDPPPRYTSAPHPAKDDGSLRKGSRKHGKGEKKRAAGNGKSKSKSNGREDADGGCGTVLHPEDSYLFAVINEALRMRSPLTYSATRVFCSGIRTASMTLPPGTPATVDMQAVHVRPALWLNPSIFWPQRMLGREWDELGICRGGGDRVNVDGEGDGLGGNGERAQDNSQGEGASKKKRDRKTHKRGDGDGDAGDEDLDVCAFIPFGAGPATRCVGRVLSYEIMVAFLPALLRAYDLASAREYEASPMPANWAAPPLATTPHNDTLKVILASSTM